MGISGAIYRLFGLCTHYEKKDDDPEAHGMALKKSLPMRGGGRMLVCLSLLRELYILLQNKTKHKDGKLRKASGLLKCDLVHIIPTRARLFIWVSIYSVSSCTRIQTVLTLSPQPSVFGRYFGPVQLKWSPSPNFPLMPNLISLLFLSIFSPSSLSNLIFLFRSYTALTVFRIFSFPSS